MKKNKKVFLFAIIFAFFVGSNFVFAAPGDPSRIPFNPGNNAQPIQQLRIGGSALGSGLDVATSNALTVFDRLDSVLGIFGRLIVGGNTWVGPLSFFIFENPDTSFGAAPTISLPVKALNIVGTLLSSSLSHTGTPAQRSVCVQNSQLILCPETSQTSTPEPDEEEPGNGEEEPSNLCETHYNYNGQWYPLPATYQQIPGGASTCYSCPDYPANGVCN